MFNLFKKREKTGSQFYAEGKYREGLTKLKREKNTDFLAVTVMPDLINRGRLPEAEELAKFLGIKLMDPDYYQIGQNALKLHQEEGNGYTGFAQSAFKKVDLKFLSQKIREDEQSKNFLEDYKNVIEAFSASVQTLATKKIDYEEYLEQMKSIDKILSKYSSHPIYGRFIELTGENDEFISPRLNYDAHDNEDPEKKYAIPLGATTGLIEDRFDYYISYGKGQRLEKTVSQTPTVSGEKSRVYNFVYNISK